VSNDLKVDGDIDLEGDMDINGTLETDALTIGGTALLANDTNNRVTTATGSGTLNGEANLTFDGTTLALADGRTLLVGGTSAVTTSVTATSQILGTASDDSSLMIGRWSADNDHAHIYFAKSRNATVGSSTIVQDDDHLGAVHFMADDGTDFNSEAASIRARIDGAPGSNDVPGRLIFSTTADGAASPTERMTIDSGGAVTKPTNPSFLVRYGSHQTDATGDGTAVQIIGNTEVYDKGSNVSSGSFTAPVAGTYAFQSQVYLEDVGSSHTGSYHYLETSGSAASVFGGVFNPYNFQHSNGATGFTNSWIIEMAANDVAVVKINVSGGTKTVDIMGSTTFLSTFSGCLIG